jgi:Zn-dependent peptidase ImmA (M78 family)
VTPHDAESEARNAADRFRRDHRLGTQPLGDLVALIEQTTGIDVAVLDVGPDEHGLTAHDPERERVVIGVARTRKPVRQRGTLAHELAHVLFADWASRNGSRWSARSAAETRADAFARHLLLPVDGLREFLGSRAGITLEGLSAVVQRFLVSPAIAAIALQQTGYISPDTKREWMAISTPSWPVVLAGATSISPCGMTPTSGGHHSDSSPGPSGATPSPSCPRRPSRSCGASRLRRPNWT